MVRPEDDQYGQVDEVVTLLCGRSNDFSSGEPELQQSAIRQRRTDCSISEFKVKNRELQRDERRAEDRRGLHIVSSPPISLVKQTPADDELRELIKQVQHPTRKKTLPDDLPPAA